MNTPNAASWDWVLAAPQDTLTPDFIETVPMPSLGLACVSGLVSYSLAETLLTSATRAMAPLAFFTVNLCLQAFGFFSILFIIHQIARLTRNKPVPFRPIFSVGVIAFIPIHLTLPLALICRPLEGGGLFLYALGELALWMVVLRRWTSGLHNLFGWPSWASMLVVLSPFLIGCLFLLLLTAIVVLCVSLFLIGILA